MTPVPTIRHTFDILAPPDEAVSLILAQTGLLPDWWQEFEYLLPTAQHCPDAGTTICHIFDVEGVNVVWHFAQREMLAERFLMMQSNGLTSSLTFDLTGDQRRTRLTLTFDYKPRDPIFDRYGVSGGLMRQHRADIERALDRLRAMLEVTSAA
jgi:hypothetical protein